MRAVLVVSDRPEATVVVDQHDDRQLVRDGRGELHRGEQSAVPHAATTGVVPPSATAAPIAVGSAKPNVAEPHGQIAAPPAGMRATHTRPEVEPGRVMRDHGLPRY
jgi:hypothetical protein